MTAGQRPDELNQRANNRELAPANTASNAEADTNPALARALRLAGLGANTPAPQPAASEAIQQPTASEPAAHTPKSAASPRAGQYVSEPAAFPQQASAYAAQQLPPAFPRRAAWGTSRPLRAWQQAALDQYLASSNADFLAVATPGAGKTTFALRVAVELLGRGLVEKVTIVCPTEHLKSQWAEAAAHVGIHIDPAFTNAQGQAGSHFDGVAVTYAQVGANPQVHRQRTQTHRTFVILDEIHHAGDSLTWGDGIREAFSPAVRRLALTGTPFRSDTSPIPFVRYRPDADGIRRSRADYTYGYEHALKDNVVRPVIFLSYSGSLHWRTSAGEEVAARLGEADTKDMQKQAWRTALDPHGQWIPAVLAAADQRLTKVRAQVPDAGGLVIASNQNAARAYARILRDITGEAPTIVLSDDAGASERIDDFAGSKKRWMVAVRMVSEGVDVPRLAVGVYATSTSTPLFFAQAVGRFVRSRKRGEVASVFIPSVQPLLQLAANLEAQRDHALDRKPSEEAESGFDDAALEQANRREHASGDLLNQYQVLDSQAEFDGVLFDGAQFGTTAQAGSVEEEDYLGIPGLLEPEQVASLLHKRQVAQMAQARAAAAAASKRNDNAQIPEHRRRAAMRKELSQLVGAWSRRSGDAHAQIHSQLRRECGGPEVARATTEQIQKRCELVRHWLATR